MMMMMMIIPDTIDLLLLTRMRMSNVW